MEMERVIFRREYDPYMKMEKVLACFPDDIANPGRIGSVTMYFQHDMTFFEPYNEVSLDWYYGSTKPLKDAELAEKCKLELEKYYRRVTYKPRFKIVQKIIRR